MTNDKFALSKKWRIPWKEADRFERTGRFTLNGSAAEVFPLLCPVLEYAWLPGWKCRMLFSDSGVAENNCQFLTHEGFGRTALWTCVGYEPDSFVDYLVTAGRDTTMRLSIRLAPGDANRTVVDWRMLFTVFSFLGRQVVRRRFTQANFDRMMRARERELNWYLAHGTMITAG